MKEGQALCTKCGRKPEKRKISLEKNEEKEKKCDQKGEKEFPPDI